MEKPKIEVRMGYEGCKDALYAEHERARVEALDFLRPLDRFFAILGSELADHGKLLDLKLLVGQYPVKAEGNPVKAGLVVGFDSSWGVFTLDHYMPDRQDELRDAIQAHVAELQSGKIRRLPDSIRNLQFRFVLYDLTDDHEHCQSCADGIACIDGNPTRAFKSDGDRPLWLCEECFHFWAEARNLTESH